MTWLPPKSDKFEFRCLEWRGYEGENVQTKLNALLEDGWEIGGVPFQKEGQHTVLQMKQLRRSL